MPIPGKKSLTINQATLTILAEIKRQLNKKVLVKDCSDNQIIDSALDLYLSWLQGNSTMPDTQSQNQKA